MDISEVINMTDTRFNKYWKVVCELADSGNTWEQIEEYLMEEEGLESLEILEIQEVYDTTEGMGF